MTEWINGLGIAVALLSFALALREYTLAGTERGIEDVRLLLETWHREWLGAHREPTNASAPTQMKATP